MAAYVLVQAEVTDQEKFKQYQKLAEPTLAAFGGKVLSAGSDLERMEGQWQRPTFVLLEFESVDKAKAWYASPEYRNAIVARTGAAVFDMIAVAGR